MLDQQDIKMGEFGSSLTMLAFVLAAIDQIIKNHERITNANVGIVAGLASHKYQARPHQPYHRLDIPDLTSIA